MDNIKVEHPLKELFKGSLDLNMSKNDTTMYSIRLSYLNPFSFRDFNDNNNNNLTAINKTIDALKYLKSVDADILIENRNKLSRDINELILLFEKKDKMAEKMLMNVYLHLLATDNNKVIIDEFIKAIYLTNEEIETSVRLIEKNGILVFDSIKIPSYYLVSDAFISNELKNIDNFLKLKSKEINTVLKEHSIKIRITIKEYQSSFVFVAISIQDINTNESILFSDKNKELYKNCFSKYITPFLSICEYKYELFSDNNNQLFFKSNNFKIAVKKNISFDKK